MRRLHLPVPTQRPNLRALLAPKVPPAKRKFGEPERDAHMTLNQWIDWCDEVSTNAAELSQMASVARNVACASRMSVDFEPGRSGRRLGVTPHKADLLFPKMLETFTALAALRGKIRA